MREQILVVEDEPDISALVAYHLARSAYRVRTAADGSEALALMETEPPDLVVLDRMLQGISGLEVLEEMKRREELRPIPVILLTARVTEQDRIEGLEAGADDYVAKPFSPRELVLRVEAVLRRARRDGGGAGSGKVLRSGGVVVDVAAARAEVEGREVELTPTEFHLLRTLLERRGRVQSRRQLLQAVWETTAEIQTRTVDMHVQRLRGKLGSAAERVETVRGFGYRFRSE